MVLAVEVNTVVVWPNGVEDAAAEVLIDGVVARDHKAVVEVTPAVRLVQQEAGDLAEEAD